MTGFLQRSFIPLATLALGLLLICVGVISKLLAGPGGSFTPLIPAFAGGLFLILGAVSFKASLRKTMIHIALVVALILGAYCTYQVPEILLEDESARKMFAFLLTAVGCIAYVVLGVRSFVEARQARKDADRAERKAEAARV